MHRLLHISATHCMSRRHTSLHKNRYGIPRTLILSRLAINPASPYTQHKLYRYVGMWITLAQVLKRQDVDQNVAPLAGIGNERSSPSLRLPMPTRGDQSMAARTTFCKGSVLPSLTYTEVGHPPGMPTHYFFSTASESSFPGEKRTRSFAGTVIGLRSRGLTTLRAALLRTLKEPKPTKRTS